MTELFKLVGKVVVEGVDAATKAISGVGDEGEQAEGKLSKAFKGIGNAALTLGKVVTKGLVAGAGAIALITGMATNAYASYEQLVGGVDTLFGDSTKKVQRYAAEAYKTAGLSANAYMETVTSFSASLLQSLDGDTAKAAEYADRAIRDMSDNANKMGTNIGMIQNAYQGFAKQNYTMLDNLKLGYGGTKEEMKRLIKEASSMKEVQQKLGVTIDSNSMSFGNIVNAISVVQTKMGIAGTTSAEAAGTISGSTASMGAAWQNLLIGLGNDTADISVLIDQFVEAAITSFGNSIPRISKILGGVAELVAGLIPVISEMLPDLIAELLPPLIQGAATLMIGLAQALPEIIQVIIDTIPVLLDTISQAVAEAFPDFFNTLSTFFDNIVKGFMDMCDWTEKNMTLIQLIAIAVGTLTAAILAYNSAAIIKKALDIAETIQIAALIAADYAHAASKAAVTAATTALSTAMSFLTAKTTIVIAIIGALIAVGVLLYKNWDEIKIKAGELYDAVVERFTQIRDKAVGLWDDIKLTVKNNIDEAKEIVGKAIEKIKGFMNFEWSLPKIKLPHFSISGKFSLDPPSIPHFSVEWYKNAYDNPMLMDNPTIFGYNSSTGKFMGGGDGNGTEVVSGANTLMGMIQGAVATQNEVLVVVLYKILDAILTLDENMGGHMREAMEGMGFKVNDREFGRLVRKVVT